MIIAVPADQYLASLGINPGDVIGIIETPSERYRGEYEYVGGLGDLGFLKKLFKGAKKLVKKVVKIPKKIIKSAAKVVKKIGKVAKKVAPLAVAAGAAYFLGPAGAMSLAKGVLLPMYTARQQAKAAAAYGGEPAYDPGLLTAPIMPAGEPYPAPGGAYYAPTGGGAAAAGGGVDYGYDFDEGTPPSAPAIDWKKYLPYALGAAGALMLFMVLSGARRG